MKYATSQIEQKVDFKRLGILGDWDPYLNGL